MQGKDNEEYLYQTADKKKNPAGSIFIDALCSADFTDSHTIIYGHNMKDGSMFGELERYRNHDFYREHAHISFDTLYEERTYEVMAVFPFDLYKEDQPFQYYKFYRANTEAEFIDFYENVCKLALYDTGVTASFGDTFLTLSTCAGDGADQRFVVVAKRVDLL